MFVSLHKSNLIGGKKPIYIIGGIRMQGQIGERDFSRRSTGRLSG